MSCVQDLLQPLSGEPEIALGRLSRALLEDVQHVHGSLESRDVEDAMLLDSVDTNLTDTKPDARKGLPVVRIEPPLTRACSGRHRAPPLNCQVVGQTYIGRCCRYEGRQPRSGD